MQATTNMINNKVNLSKMNTQFASGSYDKVNNPLSDEAKDKLEVKVKYEVNDKAKDIAKLKLEVLVTCIKDLGDAMEAYLDKSNECTDTFDESNNLLTEEEKVKFKTEKIENLKLEAAKSVLEFVEETIELARKIIDGSTSALEMTLIMAVDAKRMADKRAEIVEDFTNAIEDAQITEKLMEVNPTLAVNRAIVDNRREEREEEREEPRFTVEDGELCRNGNPVDDGVFQDIIYALVLERLKSLSEDINTDIKDEDKSKLEAYLEKLNGIKETLLSVLADSESEEDPEETILNYKYQEAAYQACLAMQPNILQPTLSDYVS